MLPERMNELKNRLIEYATLVEGMIDQSIKGLLNKDEALLKHIIETEEPKANDFDREIDAICTSTIAQYEPLAKDLRIVIMVLKMNKDLERMADHAVNISESSLFLISRPFLKSSEDVGQMSRLVSVMLKESIDAFVNEDVALAQTVWEKDNVVDELGDKILNESMDYMRKERDGIKRSLHLMRISQNLERIADLSTNICEEVVYIVEGRDIKHHKDGDNQ
jgi:phosphate transport system protein